MLFYGGKESFEVTSKTAGVTKRYQIDFEGIVSFIKYQYDQNDSSSIKRWAKQYMEQKKCYSCNGSRLKPESLQFKIDNKNIAELSEMDIDSLLYWIENCSKKLTDKQNKVAKEILKEIKNRLQFLVDVSLNYLSLSRSSKTLSGGEAQRIRLATQIGSQLVGVLYILDEPSIGLHQRDNDKLIASLNQLKEIGNSVLVVEHDKDMIEKADYILDIGPGARKTWRRNHQSRHVK